MDGGGELLMDGQALDGWGDGFFVKLEVQEVQFKPAGSVPVP